MQWVDIEFFRTNLQRFSRTIFPLYPTLCIALATCIQLTLLCSVWVAFSPQASAQHLNHNQLINAPDINRAGIERRLQEIQATNSGLDAETISQLSTIYNATLISLDDNDNHLAKKALYQQVVSQGDQDIGRLEKKLHALQNTPPQPLAFDAEWLAADLQNLFDKKNADLAAIKTSIANIDSEINAQSNDNLAIRQRLDAIKNEQDSAAKELKTLDASSGESLIKQAKRWALTAKIKALRAEVDMLDLALISKPMRSKIMTLERAIQLETEINVVANIEEIQERLNQQRNKEAQTSLGITEQAILASGLDSPEIQRYAKKNQDLSSELAALTTQLNNATQRNKEINNTYEYVKSEYDLLEQKAAVAGLSRVFGQVLIEQRNRLPKANEFIHEQKEINDKITAAALRRLELSSYTNQSFRADNEATQLKNSVLNTGAKQPANNIAIIDDTKNTFDAYKNENIDTDKKNDSANKILDADAIAAIKDITQYRKTLASKLDDNNAVYVRVLTDSDYNLTQLIHILKELDNHILKQLMWVRTYKSITQMTWDDVTHELVIYRQLSHNFSFKDVWHLYLSEVWLSLSLALALLILAFTKTLKKYKQEYLDKTINADFLSVAMSLKYLGCVALQSSFVTIIVVHVFYIIFSLFTPTATQSPIISAYFYCFFVDYITRLLAPNAMFARYFRWPIEVVANLYRGFQILRNLFLPLMLISFTNNGILVAETGGIMGALLVVSMYLVFAYAIHQFFSVRYNITLSIIKRTIYGTPSIKQKILHYLLVCSFVVWAVFFLVGYRYSAALITSHIFESMLALAYVLVAHQVAIRWLADLELREYFRFKQQKTQESTPQTGSNSEGTNTKSAQPAPAEKLESLSFASRKLIDAVFIAIAITTFVIIWGSVLPALTIFDEVVLWSYSDKVAGVEQLVPVTLNTFLILLVFIPIAYIVVRRLPPFIEMVILNHLNISAGARYTITTLTSYSLVAAAVGVMASSIGFSWYKIQWAVAALSVGIGFGLQEIVANFISGLIILFERPIRVGDLVTINGETGYVSRIQIRATTIRDFDNKELLVPNKEFITSSLLNWTLTDKEVRVMISVGVAYGSDVDNALLLLEQAAAEHPLVLTEPKPVVTFENFGESTLSLFLRCRIASIEDRLKVVTDLHKSINRKYQEAKISIAFPQRDLHLDFSKPLEVNINKFTDTTKEHS